MPINQKVLWLAVAAVLAILAVVFYQTVIEPDRLKGTKNILGKAKTIPIPVKGPESLEWDPKGEGPYASVVDGRVLKWRGDDLGWVEFAYTSPNRVNCSKSEIVPACGRPLGLTFEKKTGDLYICDGYLGVFKVGPEGGLAELVVDQAEGKKVVFANQGDLDEEEDVYYFNDSSDKYQFGDVFTIQATGDQSGRVIRYDKKTKETKVVLENLRLNNGLALNKDGSFLITCESPTGVVHRYWIKGPKAGTRDIFAELPAYPDNIRRTATGDFWFGCQNKMSPLGRFVLRNKWFGKLIVKLVSDNTLRSLINGYMAQGVAIKVSGETGEILEILEDKGGKVVRFVSEAYEREDGKLWLGAVFGPSIWVLDRSLSNLAAM